MMVLKLLIWSFAVAVPSIDVILTESWQALRITPARQCADGTFLRRVSLDLLGRIPTTTELDAFLRQPDRRAEVNKFLERPEFSQHMAEVWTASLLGYARESPADREVFLQWFVTQIEAKRGFDEIAQELIAATGQSAQHGPVNFVVRHGKDTSNQVCRQLLGVRLDCARCHDHPFARWTQDDLHAMTRFFGRLHVEEISEANIRISDSPRQATPDELPRFLTGAVPRTSQWRRELALFVTRSKPFARNFANRLWYQLLGQGIVDPPGDSSSENQPSSPALLEYLANEARSTDFDIRGMVRLICHSKAYQLESTNGPERAARLFARRAIKPLTPEQLYDSYSVVLGDRLPVSRRAFVEAYLGQTVDEDFLLTWKNRETVQSLLKRISANAPQPRNLRDLDDVFRRTLSRGPSPKDRVLCGPYALETVLFCLMQSNEFVFNH